MNHEGAGGIGSLDEAIANGRRLLGAEPLAAADQAREILKVDPANAAACRMLGAALRRMGRPDEAEVAELDAIRASSNNPLMVEIARAISDNRLGEAEHLLRPYLDREPEDAAALRMLAEIAARTGADDDAERLLRNALDLAPAYASARLRLARLLYRQSRFAEALALLNDLLRAEPANFQARSSKAALLGRIGDYGEASALYRKLLEARPNDAPLWMAQGHLLKTLGRLPESVAAYRKAIELKPGYGEAWWSLANLKQPRLTDQDIIAITSALQADSLDEEGRLHLHFALGKAYEDAGRFELSFDHYATGNEARRAMHGYDIELMAEHVRRCQSLFTPTFFAKRAGEGCPAADPIFIVGMPRAGSTLIEQILASHSQVEGTSELPYMPNLARRVGASEWQRSSPSIEKLDADERRSLGEEYLSSARLHRKTQRSFFIDKLPNNWADVGFIHAILPNARIIDARRHPLSCCFSNYKQHFAHGQGFAYALNDLGRYYRGYVELLQHFDAILPGRIHRVFHEQLVEDPEGEIKRMLDHLGLPVEPSCLRFHENGRAVRTPSAEQVRRPLNREGFDQWRAYEAWLDPLKAALGPVLDTYPGAQDRQSGEREGKPVSEIIVNDRMQKGYRYVRTAPVGRDFDPLFRPELTPRQMLELGVFGGKYMTDCRDEFPESWFRDANLSPSGSNSALNYFRVNASTPLSVWRAKGWIYPDDPRGWFQWYCRYYMGRRIPDEDKRQIRRWKAFERHAAQVRKHCEPGDPFCRPRQRQALLQWAYDSRVL